MNADVEVCQFCSDIECDGVGCIAALDPDDVSDHPKIERLHTMLATANGLSAAMHRSWVERDRLEADHERRLENCQQVSIEWADKWTDAIEEAERWKNEVARLTEGIRAHAAWSEADEFVDRDMALWALVAPSVAPSVEPDRRIYPRCPECHSDDLSDTRAWRTCNTCHASWMIDPDRLIKDPCCDLPAGHSGPHTIFEPDSGGE